MKDGYIPKDQRKKVLLLSDDLRMPSGVGSMSRELVMGMAHRFNFAQLGAAINHPEMGKAVDASDALGKELGIDDVYCRIYPYNGYGDVNVLRTLLEIEKPDIILHFTDPRYWIWLYQMEHEVRDKVPLAFYHVWDDLPFPKYNETYYRSCDYIASISKQTHNIVRNVWKKTPPEEWQTDYIAHGINDKQFFKSTSETDLLRQGELRRQLFGDEQVDFVVMYNNRNIRRKMTSDVILAYREFLLSLPVAQRDKCRLLLHTQPIDDNGTDLFAVLRDVAPEVKAVFSPDRVSIQTVNDLYNLSDVIINLASNEGFGLGTAEALMAEKMIIVNVTGGLQDQCGFKNAQGEYLDAEREYCATWGSNHDGRYRTHGEWVVPVYPVSRALNGSPPTPYIFDDRCSWEDAGRAIRQVYDLTPAERAANGRKGHEYLQSEGFTATAMCQKFIDGLETTMANWKPRAKFSLIKA